MDSIQDKGLSSSEHETVKEGSAAKAYYVDATGHIAGRMCSNVAKLLIEGNSVTIVNASKSLLSGRRSAVIDDWLSRLEIASVVHPRHGPFHSRTPSGILTRMVRGMIARRKPKGVSAMKRLRVYSDLPEDLKRVHLTSFDEAKARKPQAFYVSVAEVASRIGWKGS